MSEISGPKFACAACGKEYKWKPELAGKKGKCKCGGVLSIPAQPPLNDPEPDPNFDDLYDVSDDAPKKAPAYTAAAPPPLPPTVMTAAAAAGAAAAMAKKGTVYRPPPPPDPNAPAPMNVSGSLKYFGFAILLGAFAAFEYSFPTDPDARARKWRALLKLANNIHPRGAFVFLALLATGLLLMGVLVLLGKMSDEEDA
jgi:hypothetical protein